MNEKKETLKMQMNMQKKLIETRWQLENKLKKLKERLI